MIGWGDLYKVVSAMAPLYVPIGLGYASVRRWGFFSPEQCAAVHRLVTYIVVPFFTFEFNIHVDPYAVNYRILAADAIAKLLTASLLAAWCRFGGIGYGMAVTAFSLCQLSNTLVVGAPLFEAMYGRWAQDVVVEIAVAQSIIWVGALIFALELVTAGTRRGGGGEPQVPAKDLEMEGNAEVDVDRANYRQLMKKVLLKLVINPNIYASVLGIIWALAARRWHFEMPSIVEGCVMIMSKAGTAMCMFSIGLFMALQEKLIACGLKQTALGMALKFIAGPAAGVIGALAVGLRGDVLRLAIIQNALPQSISSFVFAREYGVHADVVSTGVIFGTVISLPILIAFYVVLGLL